MINNLILCLGLIVILAGIILFIRRRKLYLNGIKTIGKVVKIETYSYLTPGPEFNTLYHTGITPIIEVADNGKKTRVAYSSIEDYSNLSEGDEIEVIYPKGKVNDLIIYNDKEFYRGAILVSLIGVLIVALASILTLL